MATTSTSEKTTQADRRKMALERALRTMTGLQAKLMQMGHVPGSDKLGASRRMDDLDEAIRQARSALAGRCECIRPIRMRFTTDRCMCGEALR